MNKPPKPTVQEKIAAASAAANARVAAGEDPFPKASKRRASSPILVCPHCGTRGAVTVSRRSVKRGVSGGKAAGALVTGGTSLFVTGLSRRQKVRQLSCSTCHMKWTVE